MCLISTFAALGSAFGNRARDVEGTASMRGLRLISSYSAAASVALAFGRIRLQAAL